MFYLSTVMAIKTYSIFARSSRLQYEVQYHTQDDPFGALPPAGGNRVCIFLASLTRLVGSFTLFHSFNDMSTHYGVFNSEI